MSRLKKLNKLNKTKTLSVAMSVGLVAANLVNAVPVMAVAPVHAHAMSTRTTIDPAKAQSFDKKDPQEISATVTVSNEEYQLQAVKNGSKTLEEGQDYTFDGSVITISPDYLMNQKVGTVSLKLDFDKGTDPVMRISVKDTRATAKLSTKTVDAKHVRDITATLTLHGDTFAGIEGLQEDSDYTVKGSKVTISKDYLATLADGPNTLVFNFDESPAVELTFTVKNSEVSPSAKLQSVSAENGTLTATFDKDLTDTISAADLTVKKDGVAVALTDADVTVNGDAVSIKVDEVAATDADQSIVYSVTYKGVTKSDTLVVPAKTDNTAPVIALNGDATVNVDLGGTYTELGATATDNVDATVNVTSVIKNSAGTEVSAIDTSVAGTYTITYSAKDAAGNAAADVTRTVIVAQPVLGVSSVSDITTTTFRVGLVAAPATDLTTADINKLTVLVNGNAVVPTGIAKYSGDTTGKTYVLTVPTLANQEGTLTVNGTAPAAKVATDSDNDFDFKAPTVTGVTVIDNKHVKINFSEKMDATTALNIANYNLFKNSVPGTDLINGTSVGVMSADKKSVIFTTDNGTAFVPAAYTLVVNNVRDIQNSATYVVYAGSETYFTPDASQLADTTGPSIVGATYNSGTRVLALTFDQTISISPATDVDMSKISLGGVALGAGESIAFSSGNTYNITVSAAKAALLPSGDLKISLAAGAVKDTATTPNLNQAITDFAVSKTTPPVATSATFDESTNRLVINFDQAVKYDAVTLTGITVTMNSTARVLTGGTIKSTANTAALNIELNAADAAQIKLNAATATAGTISLAAGAVQNASTTGNLVATGVTLAYTQDAVVPTITSVSYNNASKQMQITFSKAIDGTENTVDETKFSIQDGTNTVTAADNNYVGSATPTTTLTFNMAAGGADVHANLEGDAAGDIDWTKAKLVVAAANGVADPQGNALAANTYATAPSVSYIDLLSPQVGSATLVDAKTIDVAFTDEKGLSLDTASANTASNYTVALANGSSPISVSTATLQPDGRTVRLVLSAPHQYAGVSYQVTVQGVKDAAGNVCGTASGSNTATYTSNTTLDTTPPTVVSVTGTAVTGRDNDTIDILFSENVDATTAANLANYTVYTVNGSTETALALNSGNAAVTYNAGTSTATIKLTGINLQTTEGVKVVVGAGLKDRAGNPIDRTIVANYTQTDAAITDDASTPSISSVSGSAGATSDSITVTFSEEVTASSAQTASNYTFASPTGSTIAVAPTSLQLTVDTKGTASATDDVTTLVVTYPAGTLTPGGSVTVTPTTNIKDLSNRAMPAVPVSGTVTDGVAPTIVSVTGKTASGALDSIAVQFSEAVNPTDATNLANYVLESPTGTLIPMTNLKANDIAYNAATRTTTIQLDTSAATDGYDVADYTLKNGDSVKVTVSNIKDLSGNVIAAASVKTGLVNDPTNDVSGGALNTPGTNTVVMGSHSVQFVWNEEIDPSTLATTDFSLVKGLVTYPITAVDISADRKTVTLTTSRAIDLSEATLKLSLATGGAFKDFAGNEVTDLDGADVDGNGTNDVTVAAYADRGVTTLVGSTQTPISAPASFIKNGTAKRISDLFILTGGNTTNSEGFIVDGLSVGTTLASASLSEFTNVKLYYSSDTTIGNADDVQVSSTIATATATMAFTGINKIVPDNGAGYFYLVADVANTVSSGDTITIDLKANATAVSTQTGFAVTSTGVSAGTAVTVDMTAPTIAFTSSGGATNVVVTVTEAASALYKVSDGSALLNATDYASMFQIVGTNAANTTITSATYSTAGKTFTFVTSAGLLSGEYIALKANQISDAAGNALAAGNVAQGNGLAAAYVTN